jgi:hypothetical protein
MRSHLFQTIYEVVGLLGLVCFVGLCILLLLLQGLACLVFICLVLSTKSMEVVGDFHS